LSDISDVCSLIGAAIGNPAAHNEVFNCGSDEFVSYEGLCSLIHTALGTEDKDRKYLYYEPKQYEDIEFPFRSETFIVSSNKAISKLGWTPKHSIAKDIKLEIDAYEALGGLKEQWTEKELKYDTQMIEDKTAKV
jgi:nucleoside-diphosphate-sugar epimerase